MGMQQIHDLYWSPDFLLNISAELIGVALEVFLVTLIIKRYLALRDRKKWRLIFSKRIDLILERHQQAPRFTKNIVEMKDLNIVWKICGWIELTLPYIEDALAIVPPDHNEQMYMALENYKGSLRSITEVLYTHEVYIDLFKEANRRANNLLEVSGSKLSSDVLWDESFFCCVSEGLLNIEW